MQMKIIDVLCAGLTIAVVGCSGGNNKPATPPVAVATNPPSDTGTAPTPAPEMAMVRVVHLMPDATGIDVCIAAHGSGTFVGPVLKPAGIGETGLAYAQATKYLPLPAAQYDVRVVDGAATSCARGLMNDATELPALRGSERLTIAALGFLHPPASNKNTAALALYVDNASMTHGPVALRFIHASPDTATVDAGVGSGNQFTAMFVRVAYGDVGASGAANSNGYVTMQLTPYAPLLTVRLQGAADDALTFTPPTVPTWGDTVTSFLIGNFGGTPEPLRALVCFDSAAAMGALADCSIRP